MKPERVDARDVLDSNAKTTEAFRARVVGHFVRSGANAWDDYVFQPVGDGEPVDIMVGVPAHAECGPVGFHLHRHRTVRRPSNA